MFYITKQTSILEWANTIHNFEGQNAGPKPDGQSKNSVQRIVVDVGETSDEASNRGLIYTAFSTFGDAGSKASISNLPSVSTVPFTEDGALVSKMWNT
jgi:hypothetical protein